MKAWLVAVVLLVVGPRGSAGEVWIGEARFPGEVRLVRMERTGEGGTVELAETLLPGSPPAEGSFVVRSFSETKGRFRCEARQDREILSFDGALRSSRSLRALKAEGEVRRGSLRGRFSLIRLAEISQEEIARASGLFEVEDGFVILRYLGDVRSLTYVTYPAGRIGVLQPTGDGRWVAGPALAIPFPVEVSVIETSDGILWREGGRERKARRVSFPEQEVSFGSGPVRLTGLLTLPKGHPPYPAVVLLHGGGPQSRDFYWVGPFFAHLGVAVLAYDKRGVGASTGDWRTARASDLADDALAAVGFLEGRPEIDPRRIGLYGSSNGGWVAPLAASRAPGRIAFVIARSASGLPERENIVYEIESDLRAHGFGPAEIAKMRALHEREMAVVRSNGEGWSALREELSRTSTEPWFSLVRLPAKLLEETEQNRPTIERWIRAEQAAFLRPEELWRQVQCPVLVQIGAADDSIPGEPSATILREALRAGKNPDATVMLFDRGNHPLFDLPGGSPRQLPRVRRFVPGYLESLHDWILEKIVQKARW